MLHQGWNNKETRPRFCKLQNKKLGLVKFKHMNEDGLLDFVREFHKENTDLVKNITRRTVKRL